eukprot:6385560-Lingulodinium_polyedra.AAC.1
MGRSSAGKASATRAAKRGQPQIKATATKARQTETGIASLLCTGSAARHSRARSQASTSRPRSARLESTTALTSSA